MRATLSHHGEGGAAAFLPALLHTIRTWIAHHAPGRWRTLYLSDAKAFITNLED